MVHLGWSHSKLISVELGLTVPTVFVWTGILHRLDLGAGLWSYLEPAATRAWFSWLVSLLYVSQGTTH